MELDFQQIIFWALAVLAVAPGVMILFERDIVRVAFWLLGSLSGVAGMYILLDADFLGLTQVLVYIGGIMVLILFGIMMTNRESHLQKIAEAKRRSVIGGLIIASLTFAVLAKVIMKTEWNQSGGVSGEPTVRAIGGALLTDYLLPFEIISVLLLLVLCGSAFLARRREETHA